MKKTLAFVTALALIIGIASAAEAQTEPSGQAPSGTMTGPGGGGHNEAYERHPEIHRAIHVLERAKDDLQQAAHDYQGHRTKAISDIDAALTELHEALQVDEK